MRRCSAVRVANAGDGYWFRLINSTSTDGTRDGAWEVVACFSNGDG